MNIEANMGQGCSHIVMYIYHVELSRVPGPRWSGICKVHSITDLVSYLVRADLPSAAVLIGADSADTRTQTPALAHYDQSCGVFALTHPPCSEHQLGRNMKYLPLL